MAAAAADAGNMPRDKRNKRVSWQKQHHGQDISQKPQAESPAKAPRLQLVGKRAEPENKENKPPEKKARTEVDQSPQPVDQTPKPVDQTPKPVESPKPVNQSPKPVDKPAPSIDTFRVIIVIR